jgi:hypothetical protein
LQNYFFPLFSRFLWHVAHFCVKKNLTSFA